MDTPPPDDLADRVDWGEFTTERTQTDGAPPVPVDDNTTAPHDARALPGYDVGVRRGHDEALMAFRLAMMEGKDGKDGKPPKQGTDPGVAFLLEQNLRRWMQIPEKAELIRVMLLKA